eukprot:1913228-Pleurochrysis_carterae.AAC.1
MQPLSSCARRPPHSPVLPVPSTRGASPKSTLSGWCLRRIHSRPSPRLESFLDGASGVASPDTLLSRSRYLLLAEPRLYYCS